MFFGLLAVFPAVTALVSFYGLFADPSTIGANLQTLSLMLPDGSFQIVQDQIGRVLAKGNTTLGATFVLGLGFALWSANAGIKSLFDALNLVNKEPEKCLALTWFSVHEPPDDIIEYPQVSCEVSGLG